MKEVFDRIGKDTLGYPPYGYESQDGEMVINEEEAKWVRWIFEQALSGVASARIAKQLNEKQVPSRRNGNWTPTTIRGMLTNHRWKYLIRCDSDGTCRNKPQKNHLVLL